MPSPTGISTPTPAASPDAGSTALAGARILVIDDEPLNSDALADFLHGAGYRRPSSLRLDDATLQRLRDEQADLLLLELAPRVAEALQLLRALRADRRLGALPVVVFGDDAAARLHALELGAADSLAKPVEGVELVLRLRNLLVAKLERDRLAHTDALTGLPNHDAMAWRLDWSLKHALRHGTVGAVLQLGLERFRQISDALGPTLGDELLHAVSQRLLAGLRASDTVAHGSPRGSDALVARGHGEEFTLLLPQVERAEAAAAVARRLLERMAAPFVLGGHELLVTCRVGIAVFPTDSTDRDSVLRHAGVAMHAIDPLAVEAGAAFQFYAEALNARALQRLTLERELHQALERGELRLHYQPQFATAGGRLHGAEALVRWQHPQRGLLGPLEFIGLAEEVGLIVRLGTWVLHEALRQLAAWRRAGLAVPQVAVNVSSLQLQRGELVEVVRAALQRAGVDGPALCLELTESALIDSGPHVHETLAGIKRLGVRLALDDFGTGHSSLTNLRRLPIDELKIDRSFVSDCDSDTNNSAITAAIIAMAQRLRLRVVAEGVETPQQLDYLRRCGADACQGYLFARPLTSADFAALLTSRHRASVPLTAAMPA